jgi:hypothetical protein
MDMLGQGARKGLAGRIRANDVVNGRGRDETHLTVSPFHDWVPGGGSSKPRGSASRQRISAKR